MSAFDVAWAWLAVIALLTSNLYAARRIADPKQRRAAMNVLGAVTLVLFGTKLVYSLL